MRHIPDLQGIHNVIVLPKPCLVGVLPNAISIDTANIPPDIYLTASRLLLKMLTYLPPRAHKSFHDKYHYAGLVTREQVESGGLASKYRDFAALPADSMQRLKFVGQTYAWSWDMDRYASNTGVVGDVVSLKRPKHLILPRDGAA